MSEIWPSRNMLPDRRRDAICQVSGSVFPLQGCKKKPLAKESKNPERRSAGAPGAPALPPVRGARRVDNVYGLEALDSSASETGGGRRVIRGTQSLAPHWIRFERKVLALKEKVIGDR